MTTLTTLTTSYLHYQIWQCTLIWNDFHLMEEVFLQIYENIYVDKYDQSGQNSEYTLPTQLCTRSDHNLVVSCSSWLADGVLAINNYCVKSSLRCHRCPTHKSRSIDRSMMEWKKMLARVGWSVGPWSRLSEAVKSTPEWQSPHNSGLRMSSFGNRRPSHWIGIMLLLPFHFMKKIYLR